MADIARLVLSGFLGVLLALVLLAAYDEIQNARDHKRFLQELETLKRKWRGTD